MRNVAASGASVAASTEFIAGAASGGFAAVAPGTLTATSIELIPGSAFVSADAPAASIQTSATFIAGEAFGGSASTGPGATFSVSAELIPGAASGVRNEVANGALFECSTSFFPGRAEIVIPAEVSDLLRRSVFVRMAEQAPFVRTSADSAVARAQEPRIFTRVQ